MLFFKSMFFIVTTFFSMDSWAPQYNLHGLRVDTGYFYNIYPGLNSNEVARELVKKAHNSLVNTLFVYAYNPSFGALYPTDYVDTEIENGYGQQNILKEITDEAKKYGVRVVAVVPVNNFKKVWENHPDWRSKLRDQRDYRPSKTMYMLSAWHPEFQKWLKGFYEDLIEKNPGIFGIEAMEPFVDYNWGDESDFNPAAVERFKLLYPTAKLSDPNWLKFRADGLTELIGIVNSAAHVYRKASFLVQTWPARSDGKLVSSKLIRNNLGLDFDGILNLKGPQKLDYIIAELMWQQWAAEYGPGNFPISWSRQASLQFLKFVKGRSQVLIHIEITLFTGKDGIIIPTPDDLSENLKLLRDLDVGVEVYDHNQIEYLNAWDHLLSWY